MPGRPLRTSSARACAAAPDRSSTRTRNISLSRSSLRLHRLRRELRLGRDERRPSPGSRAGIGVEHDARIRSDLDLAGLHRRQIDVHVDIGDVEHGEDLAAGRQHLADIGDAVLDAAVARRDQRIVGDVDLVEFDVVRRGVERVLGLADPGLRGLQRRRWRRPAPAGADRATSLVSKPFCTSVLRAVQLLLGEQDLRSSAARRWPWPPRSPAAPADLRLRLLQRRLEVARVHPRHDLARLDHVALVGQHFGDAPGEFRVDVDLVGLDPAVAEGDPGGNCGRDCSHA